MARCSRGIFNRCSSSRAVAGWSTLSRMAVSSCSLFSIGFILLFPTAVPAQPSIDRVTATELAVDPDLELVRRAQAGDVEAFGELVERNRRAVFRAALAAVGSATEADDVAQEAFVTAFQKLQRVSRRRVVQDLAAGDYLAEGDRPAEERDAVDAAAGRARALRERPARSGTRWSGWRRAGNRRRTSW